MAQSEPDDQSSLVVAVLLVLAIFCAGWWLYSYMSGGARPWAVLEWFAIAAGAILVGGGFLILRRRGGQ